MAKNLGTWPSKRGPIANFVPSDVYKRDAVPLAVERWYDFHAFGCHLGNVGLVSQGRAPSPPTTGTASVRVWRSSGPKSFFTPGRSSWATSAKATGNPRPPQNIGICNNLFISED